MPDGQGSKVEAGTVGELVAAYVAEQCDVLASNDVGVRTGRPVVHKDEGSQHAGSGARYGCLATSSPLLPLGS